MLETCLFKFQWENLLSCLKEFPMFLYDWWWTDTVSITKTVIKQNQKPEDINTNFKEKLQTGALIMELNITWHVTEQRIVQLKWE